VSHPRKLPEGCSIIWLPWPIDLGYYLPLFLPFPTKKGYYWPILWLEAPKNYRPQGVLCLQSFTGCGN